MHHVFSFELDSEIVNVAIEVLKIAVERFRMVNDETIGAKIIDEFLGHLIVSHYHELFHNFFTLYSFL